MSGLRDAEDGKHQTGPASLRAEGQEWEGEKLIIMVRDLCLPQMTQLYTSSACSLALKRLPALSLTLCLELLGGLIISQLHQVIKIYTLIVSFMPAISALSGNLGLQASANTIRGLGTGERSLGNISNYWRTDCSLQVTSTPLVISQTWWRSWGPASSQPRWWPQPSRWLPGSGPTPTRPIKRSSSRKDFLFLAQSEDATLSGTQNIPSSSVESYSWEPGSPWWSPLSTGQECPYW